MYRGEKKKNKNNLVCFFQFRKKNIYLVEFFLCTYAAHAEKCGEKNVCVCACVFVCV